MTGASFQRVVWKEKCCVFSSSDPCWQPFHTLSLGTTFVFSVMCLGLRCGKLPWIVKLISLLLILRLSLWALHVKVRGDPRCMIMEPVHEECRDAKTRVRNYLKHSLNAQLPVKLKYVCIKTSPDPYLDLHIRALLHVSLDRSPPSLNWWHRF